MTLSFAPEFHAIVSPGKWVRRDSLLSKEAEQNAYQEAGKIKAEGDQIVVFDPKHSDLEGRCRALIDAGNVYDAVHLYRSEAQVATSEAMKALGVVIHWPRLRPRG